MWKLIPEPEATNRILRYRLVVDDPETNGNRCVSYEQVTQLWQHDKAFNRWWIEQLLENSWEAARWETPPVTTRTIQRPFEFVLVNAPGLERPADSSPFARQINAAPAADVIAFENLGRNAMMVVPTLPDHDGGRYCHLLSFLRSAPGDQASRLWEVVGREMERRVSRDPVWLSTAGGGVAWLHVRLDDRPKYYNYGPYRNEEINDE